jgi:hypothetical protein
MYQWFYITPIIALSLDKEIRGVSIGWLFWVLWIRTNKEKTK